jgi:nicotinamidase-related amidase
VRFDLHTLRPAVLVIDMQASFIAADGPFRNTGMDPVIATLNGFLGQARARGLPVLFCNYMLRADGSDAGLLRDAPWLGHMLENAPTIGVDPRVERHDTDEDMRHPRPGAFHGTGLESWLRKRNCNAVILTGVSINNAISTTAREAVARDIPAIVVRDCVAAAPFEPAELLPAYFQVLDTWTAEVADSADVLARLGTGTGPGAEWAP